MRRIVWQVCYSLRAFIFEVYDVLHYFGGTGAVWQFFSTYSGVGRILLWGEDPSKKLTEWAQFFQGSIYFSIVFGGFGEGGGSSG